MVSVARTPNQAAKAIAALNVAGMAALDDDQCATLLRSAERWSDAARTIAGLGTDGLAALAAAWRDALVRSVTPAPYDAACVIAALGAARIARLDNNLRSALIRSTAREPSAAVRAIKGLGAEGMAAPEHDRRANLLQLAVRAPAAAIQTALTVGDSLTEPERQTLRATQIGPGATAVIPLAIAQDALWRSWMLDFAPDLDADDAVKAAWRRIACYLPHPRAARLLVITQAASHSPSAAPACRRQRQGASTTLVCAGHGILQKNTTRRIRTRCVMRLSSAAAPPLAI